MCVRIADRTPERIGLAGAEHMPERMPGWWASIARMANAKLLSNLPADIPIKAPAGAFKARWICEQAHQQLKKEPGLDHFEGRSWAGLHRHALMTMLAYV